MNIPLQIISGDTVSWRDGAVRLPDGSLISSADFSLVYCIAGASLEEPIKLAGIPDGEGWAFSLPESDSKKLVAGDYWWQATVAGCGRRVTVATGNLSALPSLDDSKNYDGRTIAQKALAEAELALATYRATNGMTKRYSIGTRSIEFTTIQEILEEINYWRSRVERERAGRRRRYVRFAG